MFGGIGGLELGLAEAGHSTLAFCEADAEAATILRGAFPSAALTRDVRRTDEVLAAMPGSVSLLTAGFPCTDLSQAGRTDGFDGRASPLVRDVLRLLARRPITHVVLENVPNWRHLNGGAHLDEVVTALERLGYRWAYRTLDARAFGLPQRRLRLFLYASLEGDPRAVLGQGNLPAPVAHYDLTERAHGFYWTEGRRGLGWGEDCVPTLKGGSAVGVPSPPAIVLTDGRIVTPAIEDAERLQGLPVGWTDDARTIDDTAFRQARRWLLVGNAVNVRVAAWIGARLAHPRAYGDDHGLPLGASTKWPAAAWSDGTDRWALPLSAWPVARPALPLEAFLMHPTQPLSTRATAGFLSRLESSRLRTTPGFVEAVRRHLQNMRSLAA